MATIYDVARESGFSLATISNVVNKGSRPVRPETRDKILATIQRLNYHPNAIARGLAQQKTHTLGIVFGVVETSSIVLNDYSLAILQAVLSVASESGYNVTHITQKWTGAADSLIHFRDGRTDGFLVVAPPTDSDLIPALASLNLPLVAVSWSSPQSPIPSTDVDDEFGAEILMSHLLELGHRRIAHITGHPNLISGQTRKQVYLNALERAGVSANPDYLRSGHYTPEEGYTQTRSLFNLPEPPTAIFAGNDEIAFGVFEAANELGIDIPGQLSVVGVDDRPMAAMLRPSLTTLRQPFTEVGMEAAKLLIRTIKGDPIDPKVHLFKPTFVARNSTSAPPAVLPTSMKIRS